MFKSVFAKYVTASILIIVISFSLLALLLTTVVNNYMIELNETTLSDNAYSASAYVETKLRLEKVDSIGKLSSSSLADIKNMLTAMSTNGKYTSLTLIGNDGYIYFCSSKESMYKVLGEDELNELIRLSYTDGSFSSPTIDRLLNSPQKVIASDVRTPKKQSCATVFSSMASSVMSDLLSVVVKTVLSASVCVIAATLIAVYIISLRMSEPLRDMRRAVKKFSNGDFSARVKVTGRDEIADLAISFNNMAKSLEDIEKTRNSFVANVSHDLRSPMTTIGGFIDGILDGVIPPEKQDHYLKIISSEIKRLSRLVSGLLDLSKIQAGERKFVMTSFDICEMGRQIIISFEQKLTDKKLEVEFETSDDRMTVYADYDAIYQVFYNIFQNAVKFTNDGGLISINIESVKGEHVKVRVFNTGAGIPPEDLPYIFDRFFKSDKSRGIDKTGTGLGLYISKLIIGAHEETITVDSEFGKNCEFTFTLKTPKQKDGAKNE